MLWMGLSKTTGPISTKFEILIGNLIDIENIKFGPDRSIIFRDIQYFSLIGQFSREHLILTNQGAAFGMLPSAAPAGVVVITGSHAKIVNFWPGTRHATVRVTRIVACQCFHSSEKVMKSVIARPKIRIY